MFGKFRRSRSYKNLIDPKDSINHRYDDSKSEDDEDEVIIYRSSDNKPCPKNSIFYNPKNKQDEDQSKSCCSDFFKKLFK